MVFCYSSSSRDLSSFKEYWSLLKNPLSFVDCPSVRFAWWASHYCAKSTGLGRKTTEVKCHFHHILSRVHTVNMAHYCCCWPWWHGWECLSHFSTYSFSHFPYSIWDELWVMLYLLEGVCLHQLFGVILHERSAYSLPITVQPFILSLWICEHLFCTLSLIQYHYWFCYSYYSSFSNWELFQLVPISLWHTPMIRCFVFSIFLLSGIIKFPRFILCILYTILQGVSWVLGMIVTTGILMILLNSLSSIVMFPLSFLILVLQIFSSWPPPPKIFQFCWSLIFSKNLFLLLLFSIFFLYHISLSIFILYHILF